MRIIYHVVPGPSNLADYPYKSTPLVEYEALKIALSLYKIEILLYPNISVYVCEVPSWKLEHRPLLHPTNT